MGRDKLPYFGRVGKGREGRGWRIYPWGNQPAGLSRANFGRTGFSGPVRDRPERLLLYPPIVSVDKYENSVSPYGVYQMAGNVAEWTAIGMTRNTIRRRLTAIPRDRKPGHRKRFEAAAGSTARLQSGLLNAMGLIRTRK